MSDKLHQLIATLSKSEKRYFKLYAQRFNDHEDSLRVQLFDLISKQEEYNEEEILKKIAKKYDKNRFSVEKVYLYQMILESLRAYHAKSFQDMELLESLQTIQILWIKGLPKAAHQLLTKQKKMVYQDQGGSSAYLLNLITFEKMMAYSVFPKSEQQEQIKNLHKEYDNVLKMLEESNQVTALIAESNYLRNHALCHRDPEIRTEINNFLKSPFLNPNAKYLRMLSQHNCMRIRYHMAKLLKNFEEANRLLDEMIDLLEGIENKQPHLIAYLAMNLISKMDILFYLPEAQNKIEDKIAVAEKLRNIPTIYRSKESLPFSINSAIFEIYVIQLDAYIFHKDLTNVANYVDVLCEKMLQHKDIIDAAKEESKGNSLYLDIYHTFSKAFFMLGNFEKALDYNHFLANMGDGQFMTWDFRKVLLLSIYIHFELGNYRLIPYQIEKLEHWLKKFEAPFQLEKILCKYFRKIVNCFENSAEQMQLFEELHEQLLPLKSDPFESIEIVDFDIWSWVASKKQS